jgi:paraquat-inducible protein A
MALCSHCGAVLVRFQIKSLNTVLALTISAIALGLPALLAPLFIVNLYGRERSDTVFTGVASLWTGTLWPLALMVLSFVMLIPGIWLCALLLVFLCLMRGRRTWWLPHTFRLAETLDEWAMPDVFMVGALVAYTRLRALASIDVAAGGWCWFGFAMIVMALRILVDHEQIWSAIGGESPEIGKAGRIVCRTCALALPLASIGSRCPRCRSLVHARKPGSFDRALAFLIAAYLLYVPANLLPVLKIVQLAGPNDSTILGGIKGLAEAGMWPLAIIVFTASIAIPMLKLVGLTWCLVETRQRSAAQLIERTRLYRGIGRIGRWSNIDVFVVSILTALMQFDLLGTIHVETGAVAFGAVVVLTMLASRLFDSRIMWDAAAFEYERH